MPALAPELAALDASFVVVGTGDRRFEDMWRWLQSIAPDRIRPHIGFDERRAHLVEGGADIFLMPSRYEPCGLNQMYSMRYGTVPVVRAVGGLVDTVLPYDRPDRDRLPVQPLRRGGSARRLEAGAGHATGYRDEWRRLQVNGMTKDFSWDRSAAEYVKVYKGVMAARRMAHS